MLSHGGAGGAMMSVAQAEREFFPRLLMFGERCGEADMAPEGEVQIMLAKSLPALQLLVAFIDQLQRVAHQLLHQVRSPKHRLLILSWQTSVHLEVLAWWSDLDCLRSSDLNCF
jgi:hypothetical protein